MTYFFVKSGPDASEKSIVLCQLVLSANSQISAYQRFPEISLFIILMHVRKVVSGFGRKSCVSIGEKKPEKTHRCVTDRLDITIDVKMALNSNTGKQAKRIKGQYYYNICNRRKGTFGHLRKVSFQISMKSPRRLI